MENGEIRNGVETQGSLAIVPVDQRSRSRIPNDIMTLRLKNRERQRRYRARKRLEADIKRSSISQQSPQPELDFQSNVGISNNFITRVYCKRDWKKDARRANSTINQEDTTISSINPTIMVNGESQTQCGAAKAEISVSHVVCDIQRKMLSKRDWKAEARKKNQAEI